MTRVLVAGGGVAALEAILALRDLAEERVSIELVAPEPQFWYRPLAVLEPFGMGTVHGIELVEIAESCGAGFTLDAVVSVDADAHVARTRAGAEFEYDAFVLASGARPERAVHGAFTFRGPADTTAFRNLLTEIQAGAVRHLVFTVPGGASWPLPLYELALLATTFLAERHLVGVETTIVTPEDPGRYALRFDMVNEGVAWFSGTGVPDGDAAVSVSNGFGASYAIGSSAFALKVGRPTSLAVTLTNTGTRTWPAAGSQPVHLGYHLLAPNGFVLVWDGSRANLATDVAPGQSATVQLPV